MIHLADRLANVPPYLFAQIDEARERAEARGIRTLSFGIGDPDQDPPLWIRELLAEEVLRSGNHRYPSYKGHPALFESVFAYLKRRFGIEGLGPEHIITTLGSKEGLAHLVLATLNNGDAFLLPDPLYPIFGTNAGLFGCRPIPLPIHPGTNFMPELSEILTEEDAKAAKVMYVNYPHNPTGQMATREYLARLVAYAREHNIILVSDAAYPEVYYDEANPPASLLEFEGALDCVIEFHSFSKTFNMTGWRIGFAVGNPQLIRGLLTVKSNIDSGTFNSIQLAMARALVDPRCDQFLADNRKHYSTRMAKITSVLDDLGVGYCRPQGTIFVWARLPENAAGIGARFVSENAATAGDSSGEAPSDSFAWCAKLLDETGVVTGPGRAYGRYGEGFFRMSLTTPDDQIDEGLERLSKFVRGEGAGG